MDRFNSLLTAGHRGADALNSYVKLQWLGFYALIVFAVISMMSVFIYVLSRVFGKISYNRKQDRLHRELRAQIEERDELLQTSDKKWQKIRTAFSELEVRLAEQEGKLSSFNAMKKTVDELKKLPLVDTDKIMNKVDMIQEGLIVNITCLY